MAKSWKYYVEKCVRYYWNNLNYRNKTYPKIMWTFSLQIFDSHTHLEIIFFAIAVDFTPLKVMKICWLWWWYSLQNMSNFCAKSNRVYYSISIRSLDHCVLFQQFNTKVTSIVLYTFHKVCMKEDVRGHFIYTSLKWVDFK